MPEGHRLLIEELFVPILCLIEYHSFEDALRLCNSSEYGLTAGIYTRKEEEVEKFTDSIEAGVIYVNRLWLADSRLLTGRFYPVLQEKFT